MTRKLLKWIICREKFYKTRQYRWLFDEKMADMCHCSHITDIKMKTLYAQKHVWFHYQYWFRSNGYKEVFYATLIPKWHIASSKIFVKGYVVYQDIVLVMYHWWNYYLLAVFQFDSYIFEDGRLGHFVFLCARRGMRKREFFMT